jgi:diguanylate cyclase (GGDEF)-like protein/PAS domain S-box-containing protein
MTISLEDDYEALTQFLYIAPIGLVQARIDGEIMMVNPVCAQLLMPLSRDGELANLFTALEGVAPDLRHMVQVFGGSHGMVCDAFHLQVSAGRAGRLDAQILSLSLLKLDDQRLMAVLSDVTKSVKRDRELRQSLAWINTIVTGLTDYALVALDADGCAQTWNPSIGRVAGFDSAATVGQSYSLFYPADGMSSDRALDRLHEADDSGWSLDEGWRVRADGTRYWGSCLIAPLQVRGVAPEQEHPTARAYSLIIRDISDRREATEALRQSVSSDYLTGLANRRALFEAANLEVERWRRMPRPLSVVMIDADHFKAINDAHGHVAGDAVLRHLAAGMSFNFHAMDVVARIGGEEFVVLMPGITLAGAEAAALRLCRSIEAQTVEVNGAFIRYTISAGVAMMEEGVQGVDELLERADSAMYAAKTKGRNRVERWDAALAPSQAGLRAARGDRQRNG